LARRHSYTFRGKEQLMRAEDNVVFGTTFLRELMDRFGDNPVLVSGAYNAGPGAVQRWLEKLPRNDPAVWVEVLPFYETRDYIPRVLAFATIYDWRLQLPVRRVTARMPPLESGTMAGVAESSDVAGVACPAPIAATAPGS
jgi:soluble lytic murein transglycosylase